MTKYMTDLQQKVSIILAQIPAILSDAFAGIEAEICVKRVRATMSRHSLLIHSSS